MVRSCSVKHCGSKLNKDRKVDLVSFHMFPHSKPDILGKWIAFLKYDSAWTPSKSATICSKHFDADSFRQHTNNKVLLPDAVPSLHPPLLPKPACKERKAKAENNTKDSKLLSNSVCRFCTAECPDGCHKVTDRDVDACVKYLKIKIYTGSEASPQNVCKQCKIMLASFKEFIIKFEKAERKLRKLEKGIESEDGTQTIQVTKKGGEVAALTGENCNCVLCQRLDNIFVTTAVVGTQTDAVIDNPTHKTDKNMTDYKHGIKQQILILNKTDEIRKNLNTSQDKPPLEYQSSHLNERIYDNPGKKIKILQDIEIGFGAKPNLLDSKLELIQVKQEESPSIEIKVEPVKERLSEVQVTNGKPNEAKPNIKSIKLHGSDMKCDICGKEFISKYARNHHKKYCCNIVSEKNITRLNDFNIIQNEPPAQTIKVENESSLICNDLNKFNPNEDIQKTQVDYHFIESSLKLEDIADVSVPYKKIKSEKRQANYLCQQCNISFTHQRNLKRHYAVQHLNMQGSGITFKCQRCGAMFAKYSTYKRHQLEHSNPYYVRVRVGDADRWLCNLCNHQFSRKYSVKLHLLQSHQFAGTGGLFKNIFNYKHECLKCNVKFVSLKAYRTHVGSNHLTMSTLDRRVVCQICNKSCSAKNFKRHLTLKHRTSEINTANMNT